VTLDFAGAIKKALDATTADDQVEADVDELVKRIAASGPAGFKPQAPTEGQLEAITRQAIATHGLLKVFEQAIVDEVIRAATGKPAAASPMGAGASTTK
jgi:hypothetical protein